MVAVASLTSTLLGLPLGLALFWTSKKKEPFYVIIYRLLSLLVNAGRSFPFAILMIALIPLTRALVGTSLGTTATIVPLTFAATPFLARLVESAFLEVDPSLLQTITLFGAKPWQLFRHVLLTESLPSLVRAFTTTAINITSYSAMAGLIGGGGLGQIALQYGYQRFNTFLLGGAVLFLFLFIEILQYAGNQGSQYILRKRGVSHHV
ncbi:MAG: ABC transporter permease subunit [Chlamydiae bacterium]|nr:ABC transporter permease subunit [Chlamydiota bacterium]